MGQGISKEGKKLFNAIKKDEIEAVQTILTETPDAIHYKTFFKQKNALHLSSEQGNVLITSCILDASQQLLGQQYITYINAAAASGNTALMLACKRGHPAIVRALLEEGASPLPANRRADTAAHLAAARNHPECLELILDAPIRTLGGVSARVAYRPVRDSAGETRFIDAHDRDGFSPLHLAAIARSFQCALALVQRGALLDTPVLRGMERLPFLCGGSSPLHIAAAQGDTRTCIVLLEGQARHPGLELRRIRNMVGLTPLNVALLAGQYDIIRVLVDRGEWRDAAARGEWRNRPQRRGQQDAHGVDLRRHSALHQMIPLTGTFPESLRVHMLAVLQRSALLLQLKEIAEEWQAEGEEQLVTDAAVASFPGLNALTLSQISELEMLLERQGATMGEVLNGMEAIMRPTTTSTTTNSNSSNSNSSSNRVYGSVGEAAESQPPPPLFSTTASASSSRHRGGGGGGRSRIDWALLGSLPGFSSSELQAAADRHHRDHGAGRGLHARRRNNNNNNNNNTNSQSSVATSTTASVSNGAGDDAASVAVQVDEEEFIRRGSGGGGGDNISGHSNDDEAATVTAMKNTTTTRDSFSFHPSEEDGHEKIGKPAPHLQEGTTTTAVDDCAICMDLPAEVSFSPCSHSLCFHCACRLCLRATVDGTTCPFCRRRVESVAALVGARPQLQEVENSDELVVEQQQRAQVE